MTKRRSGGIAAIIASGRFPGVVVKGTTKGNHGNIHVEPEHAAPNLYRDSGLTPQQSERRDAAIWKERARIARETKNARRLTRRADDEIQTAGHIPYSVYTAMRRKHGKDYWSDNPKEKMRRHGLAFDT